MRVITWKPLPGFWALYPDAQGAFGSRFAQAQSAAWTTPTDMKSRYSSASFVANNRVVFKLRGNTYRLVVAVHYNTGFVYVRFIGTHADYDRIDVATI